MSKYFFYLYLRMISDVPLCEKTLKKQFVLLYEKTVTSRKGLCCSACDWELE